jgi:hypothetical protein
MSPRALWLFLPCFVLSAILLGCPPQIGKDCTLSTDCSQLGDRLCDTSQPDGYCTVFNCEPDSCPNAICVAFQPTLDPACGTANSGEWPRLQRTFCLAPCSDPGAPGDCRSDGYECVDLQIPANPIDRAAQVIDTGANDGGLGYMVCMVNAPEVDAGAADCINNGGHCKSGQVCVNGVCITTCSEDGQCHAGDICYMSGDAGTCIPAVCDPPDAGYPQDGAAPWTPYNPDAGDGG